MCAVNMSEIAPCIWRVSSSDAWQPIDVSMHCACAEPGWCCYTSALEGELCSACQGFLRPITDRNCRLNMSHRPLVKSHVMLRPDKRHGVSREIVNVQDRLFDFVTGLGG